MKGAGTARERPAPVVQAWVQLPEGYGGGAKHGACCGIAQCWLCCMIFFCAKACCMHSVVV